eukprot:COSAG01_NODE_4923_length_4615_cov_3.525232_9_plen_102_part_00
MTIRLCLVLAGAAIVYLSHEAAAAPNAPKDVKFQPPFGKRLHNFKENPATTTGVDACIFLREGGFCDSWKARRKDMIGPQAPRVCYLFKCSCTRSHMHAAA